MATTTTEMQSALAEGLDEKSPSDILAILHAGQVNAVASVADAIPQIARAAERVAETITAGGALAYSAAGSSGLMALADGLELPGTFGIPRRQIAILIAGGEDSLVHLKGGPEDDAGQAETDVQSAGIGAGDCLISLAASGTTPYAVSSLRMAARLGAATIGIANNFGATLLTEADIPILLETPPEIVAGSTRMGAGTAQKITLNMISTLAAVHMGHIHDGHMINVATDNAKLRKRAEGIVATIGGCRRDEAGRFLDDAGGSVKTAILLCAGASDRRTAEDLLENTGQKLRSALSRIEGTRVS